MRLTLTLIALSFTLFSHAQNGLIFLDDDGNSVEEKKAVTVEQHIKISDTLYEVNTYTAKGPRRTSIQYSDRTSSTINGRCISYDEKGNATSVVRFNHGVKDGNWYFLTDNRRILRVETYDNGTLLAKKDSTQLNEERDRSEDPLVIMPGAPVEIQAELPGGPAAWLNYLSKNMRYPDHAVDNKIQGSPIVAFVVGKDGKIEPDNVYIERSVEYSLDIEAFRVILQSPLWVPAVQKGKTVRSWKKQPLTFKLNVL